MDPTGDLLEVDAYTVVEVLEAAVVRLRPIIRGTEIVVVTPTWTGWATRT